MLQRANVAATTATLWYWVVGGETRQMRLRRCRRWCVLRGPLCLNWVAGHWVAGHWVTHAAEHKERKRMNVNQAGIARWHWRTRAARQQGRSKGEGPVMDAQTRQQSIISPSPSPDDAKPSRLTSALGLCLQRHAPSNPRNWSGSAACTGRSSPNVPRDIMPRPGIAMQCLLADCVDSSSTMCSATV